MRVSDERLDPSGLSRPDGAVPYTLMWGLAVPRLPGVYVINDLRGPLYVGRSIDLRRRFEEHYDGSHNPLLAGALSRPLGLLTFSWFLVDQESLSTVEHRLIGILQPICNIIKSKSKTVLLQRN